MKKTDLISIEDKASIDELIYHNGGVKSTLVGNLVGTLGIDTLMEYLEKQHGYVREDIEDNTNGWQVDYWYYLNNKNTDNRLCISGSLLYGEATLSFCEFEN